MTDNEPAQPVDANTPVDESPEAPRGRSKFRQTLFDIVWVLVAAMLMSAGIRAFAGELFVIPSGSMQNTLQLDDRVLVSKVSDYHRGDIIVFEDPAKWLTEPVKERSAIGKVFEKVGVLPSSSTSHLVKRLIGLPGDRVVCCDVKGRVSVNGSPLDEPYVNSMSGRPSDFTFEVTVPKGRVFVMGDHRDSSSDSRCKLNDTSSDGSPQGMRAFVPQENIVGPVVAIVSPFDRWTRFSVPETFKSVPDPGVAPDLPSVKVVAPTC